MKIKKYFTTKNVIEGLVIAILLSAFIYIEHFKALEGYYLLIINSFFALFGFYKLIKAKVAVWFFSGFFISIFWLWWLGVSFYYYNLNYLIIPSILLIGLLYGTIFLTLAIVAKKFAKILENLFPLIDKEQFIYALNALAIFILSFLSIFSFDWLKLNLIFIDTIFGVALWQFALILIVLTSYILTKKWYLLLLIFIAIDFKKPLELNPNFLKDIKLISTNVDVKEKWLAKNQQKYTRFALDKIVNAIANDKKLIIFPESYLPYFLNLEKEYLDKFLKLSNHITIVIGSLYYGGVNNHKNTAYIISKNSYQIANKVVLVPFGEANPLPKFLSKYVNKIFFDGAIDYSADNNFTYIKALNKKYKVAICYEGTNKKTYQDNPKYLILISNNAWFKPSIEPVLQKLLLKYYSRLHETTIYHSINGSKSYIIMPHLD
jgi:apolipoprotein N-acyltransferase